jgi:hypothetical protein
VQEPLKAEAACFRFSSSWVLRLSSPHWPWPVHFCAWVSGQPSFLAGILHLDLQFAKEQLISGGAGGAS